MSGLAKLPPLAEEGMRTVTWNMLALFGDSEGGALVERRWSILGRLVVGYDLVFLQGLWGRSGTHTQKLQDLAVRHRGRMYHSFVEVEEDEYPSGGVAIYAGPRLASQVEDFETIDPGYIVAAVARDWVAADTYFRAESTAHRLPQYRALGRFVSRRPGRWVQLSGDQNRADDPHDRYFFGAPEQGR